MLLIDLLKDSINRCTEGFDKVALQISGGLDSAVLQAIGEFENLYCVTFPNDGVDNMEIARLAAKGKKVIPVTFDADDLKAALPEVKRLTGGRGTWSQVCQYYACLKIAEDGCDLVLTGEGADELFGGYTRYRLLHNWEKNHRDPRQKNYQSIVEHMQGSRRQAIVNMLSRTTPVSVAETMVPKRLEHNHLVKDMAAVERDFCLPALLEFGAAMAQAHGLVCRFPFMDPKIVAYSKTLQPDMMVDDRWTKVTLRRAAQKLGVHERIVEEETKRGLFIPPTWRPAGAPKWSRTWFEVMMAAA
jgi:asparagine synthetase B (glutamine-hydrolysing)